MLADDAMIRPGLYRLPEDPVGPRVLIPGFVWATAVRGAFGWFSAGWIGRLAPGLAEYINRRGVSPIEFIVAPVLFPAEREAVEQAVFLTPEQASQRIVDIFCGGSADASALAHHALECLAWMIATGRLRLRIAVPTADSNYHPKIWLFDDGADQMLARGSGNATARGITGGVEHFDVDVTWIEHSRQRVRDGMAMLDDWSRGQSHGIERVIDLPQALEEEIIQTAPEAPPSPGRLPPSGQGRRGSGMGRRSCCTPDGSIRPKDDPDASTPRDPRRPRLGGGPVRPSGRGHRGLGKPNPIPNAAQSRWPPVLVRPSQP